MAESPAHGGPTTPHSGPGHSTTDRLAGKAHEAVDRASEPAGRAEESLRRSIAEAEAQLRSMGAKVSNGGEESVARLRQYVQENPTASLALAFSAGLLASTFFRR